METTEMKHTITDLTTGEVLAEYTPGEVGDAPALLSALAEVKRRLNELSICKRAIEQAFLKACPNGLKTPDIVASVDININREDARVLASLGLSQCISISESVRYRLLKTEVKKLELLEPEKHGQLMDAVANCSRTIRLNEKEDE